LEEDALKETDSDEARNNIIKDFELDEDIDTDLIDKLVERDNQGQKKLKTAIRQKIDWRTKAKTTQTEVKSELKTEQKEDDIEVRIEAKFKERELSSLDLDSELKKEVEEYAKLKGTSINDALNSPYIQFMKEEKAKDVKNDNASIGGKRRTQTTKDYSDIKPTDFDLTTEEGRNEFAEYEKHIKSQLG
jgi:hypothetical protein